MWTRWFVFLLEALFSSRGDMTLAVCALSTLGCVLFVDWTCLSISSFNPLFYLNAFEGITLRMLPFFFFFEYFCCFMLFFFKFQLPSRFLIPLISSKLIQLPLGWMFSSLNLYISNGFLMKKLILHKFLLTKFSWSFYLQTFHEVHGCLSDQFLNNFLNALSIEKHWWKELTIINVIRIAILRKDLF